MSGIKQIVGWFFRQGFVFILIVFAIAFHQFVWPEIRNGNAETSVRNEVRSANEIAGHLVKYKNGTIVDFEKFQSNLHQQTGMELQTSLKDKKIELKFTENSLDNRSSFFPEIRPAAIIKTGELKIQRTKLTAEISMLEEALKLSQNRSLRLKKILFPSLKEIKLSKAKCKSANQSVRDFNRQLFKFKSDAIKLTQDAKNKCAAYDSAVKKRSVGRVLYNIEKNKINNEARAILDVKKDQFITIIRIFSQSRIIPVKSLFISALYILIGIIFLPFFIRIIFYYILAPIAARRASIQISVPNAGKVQIPLSEPSRVSVPITLKKDEELLVRQGYLQTSSIAGKKETRWLLDNAHFLSSIASGLVFLTRIRGQGEMTTISAVRDPFAELTEVVLPEGAACVLHPRALVAVVFPAGQTIKISSHWRLFTLNAWLTMQLRYLVFHGPGKLIVKGGRGIRVEQAERGRIFGQDQLVGFSADLSYSVIRAETFAPYFFGREQLYKDKVEQGSGILIIEEAPQASGEGNGTRHGLEGILDAGMKAFGL